MHVRVLGGRQRMEEREREGGGGKGIWHVHRKHTVPPTFFYPYVLKITPSPPAPSLLAWDSHTQYIYIYSIYSSEVPFSSRFHLKLAHARQ